jgi:hypothetical protein
MTDSERKQVDVEMRLFATRNFVRPSDCRNLEQIRYYVKELCLKIEECEGRFHYVPHFAYSLLAQYNSRQNAIINLDLRKTYC